MMRTTVRSLDKEQGVRLILENTGAKTEGPLSFFTANLLHDEGWLEACLGCDYVMHVVSPLTATKNEAEVIQPAVDGVLRVLRGSGCRRKAGRFHFDVRGYLLRSSTAHRAFQYQR